ncbi:F-box protein skip23 [Quillaja saponaria]|uniref:F-box protein skip23 n=1 Tax=Quillaja saponaria TaxID=32244 RepID=A0AAD7QGW9_QUISA|nr:F-box protein skip23 [Quillaja saponaria]
MGSSKRTSKWSDLPQDLLALITAKHLNSRPDILRVRAVCSSWRSSIPLSTPCFPLKVPAPTCFVPGLRTSLSVLLIETIVYLIEAPNKLPKTSKSKSIKKFSWLLSVQHSEEPGKLHFMETLAPSIFENPRTVFPKFLNLLEYRVSEVSRFYDLKLDGRKFKALRRPFMIKKVVVSSNSDNFSVMALGHCLKLCLWKMGDENWTEIEKGCVQSRYIDIAYHNGKFFAIGITGQTILLDCSSLHPITVSVAPPEFRSIHQFYGHRSRYLVNSVGNLLLFLNAVESDNRAHFNVYKFDEEKHIWVSVDSLGDQVLLLDNNCSVSASAQDLIGFGIKKNCIYLSFFGYTKYSAYPGYNAWSIDLEDHSIKLVPRGPDK